MENPQLFATAYGVMFILGLGLVLRPGFFLLSLLFKPALMATVLLLVAGALAVAPSAAADSTPALVGGAVTAGAGALVGFKLRRWTRGGF